MADITPTGPNMTFEYTGELTLPGRLWPFKCKFSGTSLDWETGMLRQHMDRLATELGHPGEVLCLRCGRWLTLTSDTKLPTHRGRNKARRVPYV